MMYNNISKKGGPRGATDLTVSIFMWRFLHAFLTFSYWLSMLLLTQNQVRNSVVSKNLFFFWDNEEGKKYDYMDSSDMLTPIILAQHLAEQELGLQLGLYKRVNTIIQKSG
jgi:hypothetical protein